MPDIIAIQNDHLHARIDAFGAELQSLRTNTDVDLMWHGDPEIWSGRAPILFPIVGRAPNNTIGIDGYTGPMPIHGFAHQSRFALADHGPDFCCHRLTQTDETRAIWPFDFTLDIIHHLIDNTLNVTAKVTNKSDKVMPFGFGFHPAFRWPLPGGDGPHVIEIGNHTPQLSRIVDDLLTATPRPTPFHDGRLTLDHDLFQDDAMIFVNARLNTLRYSAANDKALQFTFENLPDLGLWTKPGAPYLCIEPWHGTDAVQGRSNQMRDRPGNTDLAAGDTTTFRYTVTPQNIT